MLITAPFKNKNESFYSAKQDQSPRKDIPLSQFNKECKSQEMK